MTSMVSSALPSFFSFLKTGRRLPASLLGSAALVLAVCAVAAPKTARAQTELLSNLGDGAATTNSFLIGPSQGYNIQHAIAFTTGSAAYSLNSVQVYLGVYGINGNGVGSTIFSVGLYTPAMAGISDPGTLAVSLGTQTVTNNFTPSYTPTLFTFTPASAFMLTANTRYVVLVDYVSGTTGFWNRSLSDSVPTPQNNSGYGSVVYRGSGDNGATYSDDSLHSTFAIRGNVVTAAAPEPGTVSLLGVGLVSGLGTLGIARRRRETVAL